MLWFCGGHGVCTNDLFNTGGTLIEKRTIEWLDRYVKGDATVSTGPQFEWVDQRGQHLSSASYDLTPSDPVVASSTNPRVLHLVPFLGAGGLLGVLPIGSSRAINALNLTTPAVTTTTYVVGAPHLTFTYSGTGSGNHLYAQLVDNSTGQVLGNQVTPILVTLDGTEQIASVDLEMVAQTLKPGQKVTVQLFGSSASYRAVGALGEVTVTNMELSLPTVDPVDRDGECGVVSDLQLRISLARIEPGQRQLRNGEDPQHAAHDPERAVDAGARRKCPAHSTIDTDRDCRPAELRRGRDTAGMFERSQLLTPAGQDQPGAHVADAEQEHRHDHDGQVHRHPAHREHQRSHRAADHPADSGFLVPRHRVQQRARHPAQCECRPDVTDRGGMVKQPLGEERTEDLA